MHITINLEIMHELGMNMHQYTVCALIQMDTFKPTKNHQGWSSLSPDEIAGILGIDPMIATLSIEDMTKNGYLIQSENKSLIKPSPKWLSTFDYKLRLRSKKSGNNYAMVHSATAENGDKVVTVYDTANTNVKELFERFWYVWTNLGGTGNKARAESEWQKNHRDNAVLEDIILAAQNYFAGRGFDKAFEKSAENFLNASASYWQGYLLTSKNRMRVRDKSEKVLDQASGAHRSSFRKS